MVCARFHSLGDSFVLLDETGQVICKGLDGRQKWHFDFKCPPLMFQISQDGQFLAVLSEQTLHLLDLQTFGLKTIPVDAKFRLFEFYRNCVVLGGYHPSLMIVKPSGSLLRQIEFRDAFPCGKIR